MNQETVSPDTGADSAALALLARQADAVLFDTLDVDEFAELAFYTVADTGALVATADDVDTHVRLEATESGLQATEAEVDPDDLDAIEVTEPQPTADVDGVQTRRRGD